MKLLGESLNHEIETQLAHADVTLQYILKQQCQSNG